MTSYCWWSTALASFCRFRALWWGQSDSATGLGGEVESEIVPGITQLCPSPPKVLQSRAQTVPTVSGSLRIRARLEPRWSWTLDRKASIHDPVMQLIWRATFLPKRHGLEPSALSGTRSIWACVRNEESQALLRYWSHNLHFSKMLIGSALDIKMWETLPRISRWYSKVLSSQYSGEFSNLHEKPKTSMLIN